MTSWGKESPGSFANWAGEVIRSPKKTRDAMRSCGDEIMGPGKTHRTVSM